MKRREMKFVAGSAKLAPDRMGAAAGRPARETRAHKGRKPAAVSGPPKAARAPSRKGR